MKKDDLTWILTEWHILPHFLKTDVSCEIRLEASENLVKCWNKLNLIEVRGLELEIVEIVSPLIFFC